jgi:transposase
MLRDRGYSKKGSRCFGLKDWSIKGRTNAIGALLGKTLLTVCLITGSVNSDVFHAWMTQDLLPKTPKGAVIVMDNAAFHKRADTIQAILDQGFVLEFLPPYSPDLNPIEQKWAQAKAIRRQKCCGVDELFSKHMAYISDESSQNYRSFL